MAAVLIISVEQPLLILSNNVIKKLTYPSKNLGEQIIEHL